MPKFAVEWDKVGERFYENGTDRGVLYPMDVNANYEEGVAWNGISSVSQNHEGGESQAVYADNFKYLELMSNEDFTATLEAYSSPAEFDACDGTLEIGAGIYATQQTRKKFGLSYRTKIGSDVNQDLGYKIHLVYGCQAKPSDRQYQTVADSVEAMQLSWELTTTPIRISEDIKPCAHYVFNTTRMSKAAIDELEAMIYGSDTKAAKMPTADELNTFILKYPVSAV